jgi:hypothetical protein
VPGLKAGLVSHAKADHRDIDDIDGEEIDESGERCLQIDSAETTPLFALRHAQTLCG